MQPRIHAIPLAAMVFPAMLPIGFAQAATGANETRVETVGVDLATHTLVIDGAHFLNAAVNLAPYVEFGGVPLAVTAFTATSITATLPDSVPDGEYQIYVEREDAVGQAPHSSTNAALRTSYSLTVSDAVGATGPTGPTGPKGAKGAKGATGPAGPQGLQGLQGSQGPQGPKGDAGPQGIAGSVGAQGPAGAQGVAGAAGAQGAKGDAGPQGVAGPAGAKGDTGPQGVVGPKGDTGPQGLAGATGATGPTGAPSTFSDTYRAAWAGAGFVYQYGDIVTYMGSSWLCVSSGGTCTAEPGVDFSWGLIAQRGATGATGTQGAPGAVGSIGPAGPAGATGAKGATGNTGAIGPAGPQGATGPQGPQGIAGSTDAWGKTGTAGTNTTTNFLGTTDNAALSVRVNNAVALRIEPTSATPNLLGGVGGNSRAAGVGGAVIAGGGSTAYPNKVQDHYGTIGGGEGNTVGKLGVDGNPNVGFTTHATVAGGSGNTASGLSATIGGGRSNIASQFGDVIAGGAYNLASDQYATISGGGNNTASAYTSTVAGGLYNVASGIASFVGGGGDAGDAGTVGNSATASASSVVGGYDNTASGVGAFVGGGTLNEAAGQYSVIAGGDRNGITSAGTGSWVGGHRAHAGAAGVFVWGDSTDADITDNTPNTFDVRASGGVYMFTTANLSVGAKLPPGASAWVATSDRNAKRNFTPTDDEAILQKLVSIPLSTWSYKSEDESIRHMGPMAQDFRAAFGLGYDDKGIATIDADGVAFAAIHGLYRELQETRDQLAELQARDAQRDAELSEVRAQSAQLVELLQEQNRMMQTRLERIEAAQETVRAYPARFE